MPQQEAPPPLAVPDRRKTLGAEIGLKNQTQRLETVVEISMEPRRLELLTPCMPCRQSIARDSLRQQEKPVAATRF